MAEKKKILIVDDEETLCDVLKFNLQIEGFEADTAYSAEEAMTKDVKSYDLILLDVMMGKMSGFNMAQILKSDSSTANIPIIFCTAKDSEDDTISGLNLGADDYITKPFSLREVVARVKTVLRRSALAKNNEKNAVAIKNICYETLCIDPGKKLCTLDGNPVQLTKKEFELLSLFLSHRGVIFTREDILKYVWNDEVVVVERTIDVIIARLRKKMERYGKLIVTRHGYGYGIE